MTRHRTLKAAIRQKQSWEKRLGKPFVVVREPTGGYGVLGKEYAHQHVDPSWIVELATTARSDAR
jgi:hypothetical protein